MGWEAGLIFVNIVAIILTIFWFGLQSMISCFNKIDIKPLIMWFKMFSVITWATFVGLLILYCFIGV